MKIPEEDKIQEHLGMIASAIGNPDADRAAKFIAVQQTFETLCAVQGLNRGEIGHCIEFIRDCYHAQFAEEIDE